jgi:hypothetical protein
MAKIRRKRPNSQSTCEEHLRNLLRKPRLKDLEWYYKVGQTVQKMFPQQEGRQYGESKIEKIADAVEDHQEHYARAALTHLLWSTREFVTTYTEAEAKRWADRKKCNGYHLTWSHVKYLLGAPDDQRKSLQAECWRQEWATGRLLAEVKCLRGGKRNAGGRRPTIPATKEVALVQIADMAERLVRWYEDLEELSQQSAANASVSLKDLPKSVAQSLKAAVCAIRTLRSVTKKAQENATMAKW